MLVDVGGEILGHDGFYTDWPSIGNQVKASRTSAIWRLLEKLSSASTSRRTPASPRTRISTRAACMAWTLTASKIVPATGTPDGLVVIGGVGPLAAVPENVSRLAAPIDQGVFRHGYLVDWAIPLHDVHGKA